MVVIREYPVLINKVQLPVIFNIEIKFRAGILEFEWNCCIDNPIILIVLLENDYICQFILDQLSAQGDSDSLFTVGVVHEKDLLIWIVFRVWNFNLVLQLEVFLIVDHDFVVDSNGVLVCSLKVDSVCSFIIFEVN